MADFVTIDGTAYKITDFAQLGDEVGGKRKRVLSGKRRGDILWKAQQWGGSIYIPDTSTANAVRALADDATSRTCAGEGFPAGGVICHVEQTGVGFVKRRNTFYRTASVVFREVEP